MWPAAPVLLCPAASLLFRPAVPHNCVLPGSQALHLAADVRPATVHHQHLVPQQLWSVVVEAHQANAHQQLQPAPSIDIQQATVRQAPLWPTPSKDAHQAHQPVPQQLQPTPQQLQPMPQQLQPVPSPAVPQPAPQPLQPAPLVDVHQAAFIDGPLETGTLVGIPGGGKTTTIIRKVLKERERGVLTSADQLLLLTFSNHARDDFLTKAKALGCGEDLINQDNVRTFHSLAGHISKLLGEGRNSNFGLEVAVVHATNLLLDKACTAQRLEEQAQHLLQVSMGGGGAAGRLWWAGCSTWRSRPSTYSRSARGGAGRL